MGEAGEDGAVEVAKKETVEVDEEIDVGDEGRDDEKPFVLPQHFTETTHLSP